MIARADSTITCIKSGECFGERPLLTGTSRCCTVMIRALILLLISPALCYSFSLGYVPQQSTTCSPTALSMGLFDKFISGGSGRDELDEQWEAQQEILKLRRAPAEERKKYFGQIEKRREKASDDQADKWAWQTKNYKKGEDPIDEWRKRRESGQISDLDDQYGDEKKKGGIPFPMASFGVGGEFGVGGKFDNGGRFDLRLPYADQGYVDEDSDVMGKLSNMFGGGKKAKEKEDSKTVKKNVPKKKKGGWPF